MILSGGIGVISPPLASGIKAGISAVGNLADRFIWPAQAGADAVTSRIAADMANPRSGAIPVSQSPEQPIMAGELGGDPTRRMARAVSNSSEEAGAILKGDTQQQAMQQADRGRGFLEGMFGTIDADAEARNLSAANVLQNSNNYKTALAQGNNGFWNPAYNELVNAPAVQKAIGDAAKMAQNRTATAAASGSPTPIFMAKQANGQNLPTLEYWDLVKRGLDNQISVARRAGDKSTIQMAQEAKDVLMAPIDKAFPDYAQARMSAFQGFGAENALDAGRNILKPSTKYGDIQRTLSNPNITQQQKDELAYGAASALYDRLGEMKDARSINNLFSAPNVRNKLNAAMGPIRANQVEAFMRTEAAKTAFKNSVQGNSSTSQQLWDMAKPFLHSAGNPIAGGIVGGAYGAWESGFDPKETLEKAAMGAALGVGERFSEGRAQKFRMGQAETLASQDPAVMSRIYEKIAGDPNAMNRLRRFTGSIMNVAAASGPTALQMRPTWLPVSSQ
jgi:hypothetical protein